MNGENHQMICTRMSWERQNICPESWKILPWLVRSAREDERTMQKYQDPEGRHRGEWPMGVGRIEGLHSGHTVAQPDHPEEWI